MGWSVHVCRLSSILRRPGYADDLAAAEADLDLLNGAVAMKARGGRVRMRCQSAS
jgi:hypothetical protein